MKKIIVSLFCVFTISTSLLAQNTLVLQPNATNGKDCEVYSLQPTTNYVSNLMRGNAWTWGGTSGIQRGLIEFDLSSIPAGSIIDSAFLYLYSPGSGTETQYGSNEAYIRRLTTPWDEATVTWNTQPSFSTANQVLLPASNNSY